MGKSRAYINENKLKCFNLHKSDNVAASPKKLQLGWWLDLPTEQ